MMKVLQEITVAVMIFLIILGYSSTGISQTILSLEKCIDLALESNPRIVLAKKELEKYLIRIKQKEANNYPGIDISLDYTRQRTSLLGETGNYTSMVSLFQDLYTGGENQALIDAARADLSLKYAAFKKVEIDEILKLKQVYFKIIKMHALIEIFQRTVERRKKDAQLIRLMYNAGREKKANLFQAESAVAKAQFELDEAKENLKIYEFTLNEIMGREINTEVVIDDKFTVVNEELLTEEILDNALRNRPEISELEAKVQATQAELKYAQSGFLPEVTFSSSYGWQERSFFHSNEAWNANIGVTIPIFDGFLSQYQVKEADVALESLDVEREMISRQIALEVQEENSNFRVAQQNFKVANQTLHADKVKASLVRLEYKQGVLSFKDLRDAELDLSQAELDCLEAQYNLHLARATLKKVQGVE